MSSLDVQRTLAGTRLHLVDLGQRAAAYLLLLGNRKTARPPHWDCGRYQRFALIRS